MRAHQSESLKHLCSERAVSVPGSSIAWGTVAQKLSDSGSTPVDGPQLFAVASITKTMTSSVLARLADRGALTLDARLGDIFTSTRLGLETGRITLLELSGHTSGLQRMPRNLHVTNDVNPYADYSCADALAELSATNDGMILDGRGQHEYSNFGTMVLGLALAKVTGKTFAALLNDELFEPLAMQDSAIATSAYVALHEAELAGYDADGRPRRPWSFNAFAPAGGAISSVPDMIRYADALLSDPSWGLRDMPVWVHDGGLIWHNGQTASHHAMLALEPDLHAASIVLWNSAADIDDVCLAALDETRAVSPAWPEYTAPDGVLQALAGIYRSGRDNIFIEVDQERRLSVQAKYVQALFYPRDHQNFYARTIPGHELNFSLDPETLQRIVTITAAGLTVLRGAAD